MTLDQLNYLLILAEEQNVTRAARRLYITQPTLTTFVSKLERELGTRLFDRSRNPVRLTPNGELYLSKMKELILAEQQLRDELKYQDSSRKRIRIGLGYAHSVMWSCALTERLLSECPELDIQIREGQEADLLAALRGGDIDVFFGHAEIDPVNFHFEVLCEERILILVPRSFLPIPPEELEDNSVSNPYTVSIEHLRGKRMILPGNSMGLHLNVQLIKEEYDIFPPATIQTNNTLAAAPMIAHALGYMLGNDELVRFLSLEDQGKIVYCILPGMSQYRKYYYGYSEGNPNRDLIIKTVDAMKKIVPPKKKDGDVEKQT